MPQRSRFSLAGFGVTSEAEAFLSPVSFTFSGGLAAGVPVVGVEVSLLELCTFLDSDVAARSRRSSHDCR